MNTCSDTMKELPKEAVWKTEKAATGKIPDSQRDFLRHTCLKTYAAHDKYNI